MKLIYILFLSLTTSLFAQNNSNQSKYYLFRIQYNVDEPFSYDKTLLDQAQKFNVQSATKTTFYKKSKKPNIVHYSFNEFGKIKEQHTSKYTLNVSYMADTLISNMAIKGKKERYTTIHYSGTKKILKETFGPKKLLNRTVIQYNESDQVVFSSFTVKKTFSMSYEYEGKKLVKQRFMKNNKIIEEWSYQCTPEGESVEEKNLSTVCNYVEESNDGSYINFNRNEEKGKVVLRKTYFTKDSIWYKSESFKNDTILIYSATKSASTTQSNWYSKGKISSQQTITFDSEKRIISQENKRGKKLKTTSYTQYNYNEKGMLVSESASFKGKKIREVKYEYVL